MDATTATRIWRVIALIALVVLVALTVLTVAQGVDRQAGGPLGHDWPQDRFGAFGEPGQAYSFAWTSLTNRGTEPAIIERVSLQEVQGIEFVEPIAVADRDIPHGVADSPSYPPAGWEDVPLTPAVGFAVPPYGGTFETDYTLLLHLRITNSEGVHSFFGVTVDYRVGELRYRVTMPVGLRVCVPRSAYSYCSPRADNPRDPDVLRSP